MLKTLHVEHTTYFVYVDVDESESEEFSRILREAGFSQFNQKPFIMDGVASYHMTIEAWSVISKLDGVRR